MVRPFRMHRPPDRLTWCLLLPRLTCINSSRTEVALPIGDSSQTVAVRPNLVLTEENESSGSTRWTHRLFSSRTQSRSVAEPCTRPAACPPSADSVNCAILWSNPNWAVAIHLGSIAAISSSPTGSLGSSRSDDDLTSGKLRPSSNLPLRSARVLMRPTRRPGIELLSLKPVIRPGIPQWVKPSVSTTRFGLSATPATIATWSPEQQPDS